MSIPPIFSLISDDGKERLLLDWSKCRGCSCLVRPGKELCCPKCGEHPGRHSPTRHYRPKSITMDEALKPTVEEKSVMTFFGNDEKFIPTTAASIS